MSSPLVQFAMELGRRRQATDIATLRMDAEDYDDERERKAAKPGTLGKVLSSYTIKRKMRGPASSVGRVIGIVNHNDFVWTASGVLCDVFAARMSATWIGRELMIIVESKPADKQARVWPLAEPIHWWWHRHHKDQPLIKLGPFLEDVELPFEQLRDLLIAGAPWA